MSVHAARVYMRRYAVLDQVANLAVSKQLQLNMLCPAVLDSDVAVNLSIGKKTMPDPADKVKHMLLTVPELTPLVKVLKMFLPVSPPGA